MSDKKQVWADIARLQLKVAAPSPTLAMGDVYRACQDDLRQCDRIFKPVINQFGLVVFIGGRPAGLDIVSLASAYSKLHSKLVRSYALEALLDAPASDLPGKGKAARAHRSTLRAPNLSGSTYSEFAKAFLADIIAAREHRFPSVGHGTDYRYRSKGLAGSALVHANEVIHAAFFRLDDPAPPDLTLSCRRRYRR